MTLWRSWLIGTASMLALAASCGGSTIIDPGSGGATSAGSGANGTGASGTGANGSGASGSTSGSGASGAFGACDGPGQCLLTHSGCCGPCGIPELSELVPVALDQLEAFRDSTCPEEEPCPDCLSCPNGNLLAYCDAGSCSGAHLDDLGFRACQVNDDCRLRLGTDCYEPCGGPPDCSGLTAISITAEQPLADLVCDPDAPPPPPCVPVYPDDAQAVCNNGTCEAVFAP